MPIDLQTCNDPKLAFRLLIERLKPTATSSLTSLFEAQPTILVPHERMIQELPLELAKLQGFAPSMMIESLPVWWSSYAQKLFPEQTILQNEDYCSFFFNQERKNQPAIAPIDILERAEHKTKLLELLFLYRPREIAALGRKKVGESAKSFAEKNPSPKKSTAGVSADLAQFDGQFNAQFSPACQELILAYQSLQQTSQSLSWLDLYQTLKERQASADHTHTHAPSILFGFSQLAPYWLDLFELLANTHPISLILFNPSSAYWLAVSDQNKLMQTEFPELESSTGLFQETPAFYALEKMVHRSCRPLKELYLTLIQKGWSEDLAYAAEQTKPTNLLSWLQASIGSYLSLEGEVGKTIKQLPPQSIELGLGVFAADSIQHEIAALEIKLKEFYQLYPDTAADEVCILSPNPELYHSYLSLYGGTLAEENLTVHAYDRFLPGFFWKDAKPKADFQSFLALTDLFFSAFSSEELLQVFSYPAFIKGFAEDEGLVPLYTKLLSDIKFIKGLNADQLAWLGFPPLIEGSLAFQLKSFLVNYLYGDSSNFEKLGELQEDQAPDCWIGAFPYFIQDFTVFQPLLSFVTSAEAFLQEQRELIENKQQLFPLALWRGFFETTLELFVDHESQGPLTKELNLKWVALEAYSLEGFSHEMIKKLLSAPNKKQAIAPNYWLKGHSSISQLAHNSWSKKKAIFCLGMDEPSFQKNPDKTKEETKKLFLKAKPLDPQFEKGVDFLRALFSAEKFFWLSYVEKHKTERRFFSAALVIQNLLDYLALATDSDAKQPAPYIYSLPNFARSYPTFEPVEKSSRAKALKAQADVESDFSWRGFVRFWQNPLKSYFDAWSIDLDADVWVTKNIKQQLFLQSDFAERTLYHSLQREALEHNSQEEGRRKLARSLQADYAFTALGKNKLSAGLDKYQPWFQSLFELKPKLEKRKLVFSVPINHSKGQQTYDLRFDQYFYDGKACFFARDPRGLSWQDCIEHYLCYLLLLQHGTAENRTENLIFASMTGTDKTPASAGKAAAPDSDQATAISKTALSAATLSSAISPTGNEKRARLEVFQFLPPKNPSELWEHLVFVYQKRFSKFNFLPSKLGNDLLGKVVDGVGWDSLEGFRQDFEQVLQTWQKASNYGDDFYHLQRAFLQLPNDEDQLTATIYQNTLENAFVAFSALRIERT